MQLDKPYAWNVQIVLAVTMSIISMPSEHVMKALRKIYIYLHKIEFKIKNKTKFMSEKVCLGFYTSYTELITIICIHCQLKIVLQFEANLKKFFHLLSISFTTFCYLFELYHMSLDE